MRYLPHTDADVARMLAACGARAIDDLFGGVPAAARLGRPLDLPPALDEAALLGHLAALAAQDHAGRVGDLSFLGAGLVAHAIPAAVDALLSRSEFYTSYTPYQPEISQGTLQAIFEFQTIVAELFGLELANASMYDGATACAEAALMARRLGGRRRTVVSAGLHPEYRATVRSYLAGLADEADDRWLTEVPLGPDGATDLAALDAALGPDAACVIVQSPNFFGVVEDLAPAAARAQAAGALVVGVTSEPLALALARPPGHAGADIACGEGIGLATPPSLGGPGVGLFAARAEYARALPGRLVGETVDRDGKRGYVLTLATREQHIRRERATSNICTNQGLIALAFTIHLCLLGRRGLRELGRLNLAKGAYLRARLAALPGFRLRYDGPTFNEVAVRVPGGDAARVVDALIPRGLLAGAALGRFDAALADTLLVAVTERHRREDVDRLCAALAEVAR